MAAFFASSSRAVLPDTAPHLRDYEENPCVSGNPALQEIPLIIVPHPSTPLANAATGEELQQVWREAAGKPALYSGEVRSWIQQLCRTNLWFLMTVVLSYNGPFELVNDHLHMDMANFRQSRHWRGEGARAVALTPRSHLKSTIFTIAGVVFDLLRNPNERHLVVNAVKDKAVEFLGAIKQPMENNDFFLSLFPEYGSSLAPTWKSEEIVLGCRSREYKDPSVKALGITSAGEGTHVDALTLDDPSGLDDVDNNYVSNENMRRALRFHKTADPALLISRRRSRYGIVATRWAVDDVPSLALSEAKRFHGHREEDDETSETGRYQVYYRVCIEENEPIYPEEWTVSDFEEIARVDWWNFATQYANKPKAAGLTELADFEVKHAALETKEERLFITYEDAREAVSLDYCDVVLTVDPAGTEKDIKATTSRTSLAVWALDGYGRYTRLWGRVGYFDSVSLIQYLFLAHRTFPGYIRGTFVESNAMQKVLLPVLRREETREDRWLNLRPLYASGDKKARIRMAFAMPLKKGLVYATEGTHTWMALTEELQLFPSSNTRLDVLDESEKAITALKLPETPEEEALRRLEEEEDEVLGMVDSESDDRVGY